VGVVVGGEEVFFEKVGSEELPVDLFQFAEPLSFGISEVPRSLQENEAGVLQIPAVGAGKLRDFLPADLIEGIVEETFDVEAVEDDFRIGAAPFDRLDEGVGHVDGDELNGEAALRPEFIKESLESLGGFAFSHPGGLAGLVVHDDGDVLVPALVGELIDTDEGEPVESSWIELLADDSGGDPTDGDPGDLEEASDGRFVGDASEPGDLILEVTGEERARSCPGDLLASDAAAATVDASNGSFEENPDSQDSQVPPDAPLAVMNTPGDAAAAAASWHPSPRDDGDVDFSGLKPYRPNPEPLAREQPVE
jgi:hypothetical protein